MPPALYIEQVGVATGVSLYGGFAGTETARSQRDWNANVTIIDGSNTSTVVYIASGTVDGFTIRNGIGQGIDCLDPSAPTPVTIANNTITGNGSGIYCRTVGGSVSIANNKITGNGMDGIYCDCGSINVANNIVAGNARYGINCDDVGDGHQQYDNRQHTRWDVLYRRLI